MEVRKFITTKDHFYIEEPMMPMGAPMYGARTLTVETQPQDGEINGFGVAITGSSCYLLNQMEEKEREALLEDIYGEKGLHLSVGRISIGASDYSPELYTYDDVPGDRELKYFSIEREKAYILPMLRQIKQKRPELFLLGSPWSPPAWMKTGEYICSGFMREEFIDCYADYFLKYLDALEAEGITVDAVTPQNEAMTDQKGVSPACIWHPEIEAKFILALRKKLIQAGKNTRIWMLDHNYEYWKRVLWQLQEYPQLLEACPEVAFHYYGGDASHIHPLKEAFPELKFHFTEGGPRLYDHYDSDWCKWGMAMARALNAGCETFIGWNLMLDELGGPNVGPFFCGGLVTKDSRTGELSYRGQYRAFKHFSGLTQTGAKVHQSSLDQNISGLFGYPDNGAPVECCAVTNPDGSHILHLINPNAIKAQIQYFYGGKWWYIELLPDTLASVVFEK